MKKETFHVSRRTVLCGIAGLGLATVGIGSSQIAQAKATATPARGTTFLTYTEGALTVAWSPNGKYIATSDAASINIFNAKTGQTLRRITVANQSTLSWSPDSKYILASGDQVPYVFVFEAATGSLVTYHTGHSQRVGQVAWSPDGTRIASASYDQTVQVFEALTRKHLLTYTGHGHPVSRLAWSPDSKYIISAIDGLGSGIVDPNVHLWESATGNLVYAVGGGPGGFSNGFSWSPDGQYVLSADVDKNATIRNFYGRAIKSYHCPAQTLSVAWSPDGKYIAASGGSTQAQLNDGFSQVWKVADGSAFTYSGQKQPVTRVSWGSGSRRIASASIDNTVKVWQAV